jgi:hypothetical protein
MRIRTILAAAAAPAALAAVLLGTAGQASAAVTAQGPAAAVLTASVQHTYTGKVSQTGVPDTTNGIDTNAVGNATENNDSSLYGPIGPVWSHDDITRNVQVSPGPLAGQWTVSFVENGKYHAFADPNTGLGWVHDGTMHGTISYTVQSIDPPNMAALDAINGPAVVNGQVQGHGYILSQLFPGAPVVGYGPYGYQYTQIQDVQGVYKQVG